MFEAFSVFAAGWLLSWPALVVLAFLGILFEHNGARGWAVFTALVLAAISYFFFSVSLMTIGIGAIVYVAVGLVWSFWRYKRHVDDVVEKNKGESDMRKANALQQIHPKEMLSTITAWVVIWPFSMIENVVGDIVDAIQDLVRRVFRGVYQKIYDSAAARLGVR